MAALEIGNSRGNDRFLPGCTNISYYMIFGTDRLPQKVAFQRPRQFGSEETETKIITFCPLYHPHADAWILRCLICA